MSADTIVALGYERSGLFQEYGLRESFSVSD
jgi:hypothetical protein